MFVSKLLRGRISRLVLVPLTIVLGALPAGAIIDASLQMQLGNPSGAATDPTNHSHYLILRTVEAIDFNDSLGLPNWASWDLTAGDIGSSGRSSTFFTDTNLPPGFYEVTSGDYSGSGYDRGHMCPSGDRTDNVTDNDLVFYMSNIIPQAADNNQGIWANFETYCRSLTSTSEVLIICGPRGFNGSRIQPSGKVAIPSNTWKIAVSVPLGGGTALSRITTATRVIAIDVPNTNGVSSVWQNFVTSAGQVERSTGFTFFTALPGTVASALRSKTDGVTFPPPVITGFTPAAAVVNTNVMITGTNFNSASVVAFNGVPAVFSVDSNTQITAVVPANATSGPLSVTTPSGSAMSASSFIVIGAAPIDLALFLSHSGSFIRGDVGDTLSIVVTNLGTQATTNTITITNILPTGLTATDITGAGWTTDLAGLTATRSDTLSASAAFAPITITVNVAVGAPAIVTNVAIVTGGGDGNPANNTDLDVIAIGSPPTGPDLAVTLKHPGNFTQGDPADIYTLIVTNVGGSASAGTVSVSNNLPSGLMATAMNGTGWTTDLTNLTCTRSDMLAAGAAYPPITLTVAVAPNAPALVTNVAVVSGGADTNLVNNTSIDPTVIVPSTGGSLITLAAWDPTGLPGGTDNFGPSPFAPSTTASGLVVGGLTRGSGVGTNGTGAGHAWGGNAFTNTSATSAIAANQFATFSLAATSGYKFSCSAISKFDYRRSSTGPPSGLLQYQVGTGAFADITALAYPSNTSAGGTFAPIDLSAIPALQNVGPGTNITFRISNYGGASAGTWYIYAVTNSPAPHFVLQGTVTPLLPDLAVSLAHSGSFTQADVGDTYIITVTNTGTESSTSAVSVTDTLPSGLFATGMNGSGWTPDLATLTCSRSDPLAAGSAYPPITLTVTVATNAPATLTNLVNVSGGGQTNTANDAALDPTAIVALTPSQLWRLQWFGFTANSGPAADGANPAGDGIPNLFKYSLGLDPLVPTNSPIFGDITTGFLRLTAPKNPDATDVLLYVEVADDLFGPWTTDGTIIDQNTPTLLQVRDATPLTNAPQRFIRPRVMRP